MIREKPRFWNVLVLQQLAALPSARHLRLLWASVSLSLKRWDFTELVLTSFPALVLCNFVNQIEVNT